MKRIALTIIASIALFHCGRKEEKETQPPEPTAWEKVTKKADIYRTSGDDIYLQRCDNLTFKSLFDSFGQQIDLFAMEYPKYGSWHRDLASCYPVGSESDISRDGMIMLLHALWSRYDMFSLQRFYDYGKSHNWVAGTGDPKLTDMRPLIPIMQIMLGINRNASVEIRSDIWSGYRAHLMVLYIHLIGRVRGSISDAYFTLLKKFYAENGNNPLISAVYHRYADGDFSEAIALLDNDTYYPDHVTIDEEESWPSCPKVVHYLTTVGIIVGK